MKKSRLLIYSLLLVTILTGAVQFASAQQPPPGGVANPANLFSDPEATDSHCGYTDEVTSGPYYVANVPENSAMNTQNLDGQVMVISGVVYDGSTGLPIANAQVEMWHTDSTGNYHPNGNGDYTDYAADEITLRGLTHSDENGAYSFTSIKPGLYEGRPLHIHYRISANGYVTTFTQSYWADDADAVNNNGADPNVESCRLLTFTENADGSTSASFDFYLRTDSTAAAAVATEAPTAEAIVVTCTKLDLNSATGDEFLAGVQGMSNRMVREFTEYRPYVSIQQFRREIGKYVGSDVVAGYEQYVYVPVDVNNSDAATLQQLPGVDATMADALIAARPFADNAAFSATLSGLVSAADAAAASCYLAG